MSCNIACAVWLAEAMLTDHFNCALYLIEKENTSPANSFEPLVEETKGKFIYVDSITLAIFLVDESEELQILPEQEKTQMVKEAIIKGK